MTDIYGHIWQKIINRLYSKRLLTSNSNSQVFYQDLNLLSLNSSWNAESIYNCSEFVHVAGFFLWLKLPLNFPLSYKFTFNEKYTTTVFLYNICFQILRNLDLENVSHILQKFLQILPYGWTKIVTSKMSGWAWRAVYICSPIMPQQTFLKIISDILF